MIPNTVREGVLYDPGTQSTVALLAEVLGGESFIEAAREVLAMAGSPSELPHLSESELAQVVGVGQAKAARLAASFELARRTAPLPPEEKQAIHSADDAAAYLFPRMEHLRRETFVALLLDARNRLLKYVVVSQGSLTASMVHPRECYLPAIRHSAASVIFAHNHPSGDPTPSPADRDITEQLREAGRILGVQVLDHLVIGRGRFRSLAEEGLS